MCIVFLALGVHPAFPFVVASNRDEYFARPTKQATFWTDVPSILAGRDELRGGTWLGVTRNGRFAVLTNFRVPESQLKPSALSRGMLVEELLASPLSVEAFLKDLEQKQDNYEGFNIIAGDIPSMQMFYFSNTSQRTARPLAPGLYALSNATLTSMWFKTEHGKTLFSEALAHNPTDNFAPLCASLLRMLADRSRPAPHEKWERGPGSDELETLCQPICVYSLPAAYGTRCSTVIAATKRHVFFTEHSLREPASEQWQDATFDFDFTI